MRTQPLIFLQYHKCDDVLSSAYVTSIFLPARDPFFSLRLLPFQVILLCGGVLRPTGTNPYQDRM